MPQLGLGTPAATPQRILDTPPLRYHAAEFPFRAPSRQRIGPSLSLIPKPYPRSSNAQADSPNEQCHENRPRDMRAFVRPNHLLKHQPGGHASEEDEEQGRLRGEVPEGHASILTLSAARTTKMPSWPSQYNDEVTRDTDTLATSEHERTS